MVRFSVNLAEAEALKLVEEYIKRIEVLQQEIEARKKKEQEIKLILDQTKNEKEKLEQKLGKSGEGLKSKIGVLEKENQEYALENSKLMEKLGNNERIMETFTKRNEDLQSEVARLEEALEGAEDRQMSRMGQERLRNSKDKDSLAHQLNSLESQLLNSKKLIGYLEKKKVKDFEYFEHALNELNHFKKANQELLLENTHLSSALKSYRKPLSSERSQSNSRICKAQNQYRTLDSQGQHPRKLSGARNPEEDQFISTHINFASTTTDKTSQTEPATLQNVLKEVDKNADANKKKDAETKVENKENQQANTQAVNCEPSFLSQEKLSANREQMRKIMECFGELYKCDPRQTSKQGKKERQEEKQVLLRIKKMAQEMSKDTLNKNKLRDLAACKKGDSSASELLFFFELAVGLLGVTEMLVNSNEMIRDEYIHYRQGYEYLRVKQSTQRKLLNSLKIDEPIMKRKAVVFIKERHSAWLIIKFLKGLRRKRELQNLQRLHKTNFELFQAGSGKFLLQTLMQQTEGLFVKLGDQLRPTKSETVSLDPASRISLLNTLKPFNN